MIFTSMMVSSLSMVVIDVFHLLRLSGYPVGKEATLTNKHVTSGAFLVAQWTKTLGVVIIGVYRQTSAEYVSSVQSGGLGCQVSDSTYQCCQPA